MQLGLTEDKMMQQASPSPGSQAQSSSKQLSHTQKRYSTVTKQSFSPGFAHQQLEEIRISKVPSCSQ